MALERTGIRVKVFDAPALVGLHADGNVVDTITDTVKENPGKSVGVAGCTALIIFPPAAIWCAATLVGGATYDGDTQKVLKEITK